MGLGVVFGLIAIASSLFYIWIRRKYAFFDQHGYLHEKPAFPFGNMRGVGRNMHVVEKIRECYEKFKGKAPAFGIYFFASDVVITDLEVVKDVLVRSFGVFHNRGIYYNVKDDPLSGHLFALEDEEWKTMRTKLTPTFTSGKMKMVFTTMLDISNVMITELKTADDNALDSIDVREVLAKFTTDVIGNIAFGLEMNAIKDPESMFRKMGRKIFKTEGNLQAKVFFLTSYRKLARKMGLKFFATDVADFFMQTIRETVDYRVKNDIQRNDVMNLLIKTMKDGNLTFDELAAQCFVFFIAGCSITYFLPTSVIVMTQ